MKNLTYLIFALGLFFLSSCKEQNKTVDTTKKEHPNVLFIAVDDLNNMLGVLDSYSNTTTPNLDRLAARGVVFSDAHCQAPLCGPSRASLMTGLRPSTTGIYGMIDDNKIRSENPATKDIVMLPEYFKTNGYHTMGIGKLFHDHAPPMVFSTNRAAGKRGLALTRLNVLFGTVMAPPTEKDMVVQAPIGALFPRPIP
ncbi:sulfatase-like hydrolase/transferase [Kriegella aquimaris]|uniref:Sulfatase n=1 Tax=Kriegella aquimaris TaxID=192904 RepID=A0A1G9XTS6_9FLAO|nr:sulfatase-like hydrolase/transferase [Kriegella aquimaris]SDN00207.1 Sulfatase [Kriegella aquimaris]